jgi:hypothetical protein
VSGSGSGGGTPPPVELDCEKLTFDAEIASPQPRVIGTLKVGSKLGIEIDVAGGRNRIVLKTRDGSVAGALISGRIPELLRCLQQGESFVAEVMKIDGGDIRVRVRHS